jgi:hypothetical protein
MHNKAVNTDAQGRPLAALTPILGRGLLLRYAARKAHFMAQLLRILSLLFGLAASGCVAIYSEPPKDSSRARLRVAQADQGGSTSVRELPNSCRPPANSDTGFKKIATLQGHYTQVQSELRQSLGMPDQPTRTGDFTEVYIPANRPFHLDLFRSENNAYEVVRYRETYCAVGLTFEPQPGADYEVVFRRGPGGCLLSIDKLSFVEGAVSRTRVSATAISSYCK